MEMFAIVNEKTKIVENTILWDTVQPWQPPEGSIVVPMETASIGWKYVDGEFIAPEEPIPSKEEIINNNQIQKQNLISSAFLAMRHLEFAKELNTQTEEEEENLLVWKKYVLDVSRINPLVLSSEWPTWPEL